VVGITVTDPGCGYLTNGPAVLILGGGGTGATATAVVVGTQITSINVTSGGCCYTNAPTILIASPWFQPSVSITRSRIKITEHVVLGGNYVLESSYDRVTWTPIGPQFTASSETIDNEFDFGATGAFFRLREVFAQAQGGIVTFQNFAPFATADPTGGSRFVYDVGSRLDPTTGTLLVGTNWVAELYAGTDASNLSPIRASVTRFRAPPTVSKGWWGRTTISGEPNVQIPLPYPIGTTVTLMVKVWDFNQFPTYEEAAGSQGIVGASDPFAFVATDRLANRSSWFMEGLRAFALKPTSEPQCNRHKAQATAQVVNGVVVGITVTDPGCGYFTRGPAILIQGGGGAGATATAVVVGTQITSINVTSGGCCYTNPPAVAIASPWFQPSVSFTVSRVNITEHVVLGRNYVLKSSSDTITWAPIGPQFTAASESIDNEFDVGATGGFFRVREVP